MDIDRWLTALMARRDRRHRLRPSRVAPVRDLGAAAVDIGMAGVIAAEALPGTRQPLPEMANAFGIGLQHRLPKWDFPSTTVYVNAGQQKAQRIALG
ncbi:MAG: hypothetical protein WCA24_08195 [Thiomonas sp.]